MLIINLTEKALTYHNNQSAIQNQAISVCRLKKQDQILGGGSRQTSR